MADLPEDFYGLTPSYINNDHIRMNSMNDVSSMNSTQRIYSTGVIEDDYEYTLGLEVGAPTSSYSEDDIIFEAPVINTLITGDSAGFSTGHSGAIDSKYFVNVGEGNKVKGIKNSLVMGNGHTTDVFTQNVVILGGQNTDMVAGITNSVIIGGNNKAVNKSNITVLDGKDILSTKPIQTIIHIVDGSLNPFNQYNPYQVVEGGKDTVRPLYAKSIISVIDSNEDPVYFYEK